MAGIQHHFIAGTRADTDVQYAVEDARGIVRYQNLHIAQSAIDSACGLASTLQCVMVLLGIPRTQIERIAVARRDPLRALWQISREGYFDGTSEADIEKYISVFAPRLTCDTVTTRSANRVGVAAAKAVAAGHVPIVRFATRTFSHWATVIGVEVTAGEAAARSLLLLDPWWPRPWSAFQNARLELRPKTGGRFRKPFVLPYRGDHGELHAAHLQGLVVVKRAAQPPP